MERQEVFPDGTVIDEWFYECVTPQLCDYKNKRKITDYGVKDDGNVYTEKIQHLIDELTSLGGGLIVVPNGEYYTGALFFKKGVSLYLEKGGVLKGSDCVTDYPIMETRIEGQTCLYLSALINADGVDGFTIFGEGVIDGNGERSWKAFWHRRKWNPECTNKDEQRPRLIYVSNSTNVIFSGCVFQNSHFWTTHIYKCKRVKYLNCKLLSPKGLAPSTDAIDIDVCSDVLIKNCYFAVNDDAVVLKGGKGYNADKLSENGINERIIIEDCEYGYCHGGLTCGSESVHNRNVILRRIKVDGLTRLLWLKFRPDTPQRYEYVSIENVVGNAKYMLFVKPWTQFYREEGKVTHLSNAHDIIIKDCDLTCEEFFCVDVSEKYELYDFLLNNLKIKTAKNTFNRKSIKNIVFKNVEIIEN